MRSTRRENTRVLKTGDVLQQGETERTTGDARIELLMMDGVVMVIAPQQAVLLDAQTVHRAAADSAGKRGRRARYMIDELLKALERGSDLSEELASGGGRAGRRRRQRRRQFLRAAARIVEPTEALQFQFGFRPPELPPGGPARYKPR